MTYTVFDTETTGPKPKNDRIVTAAFGTLNSDGSHDIQQIVMDPGIEIPEEAANIHGWTTERVKSYSNTVDYKEGVSTVLGYLIGSPYPVVAYNARFDFTLLWHESYRVGLDPTPLMDVEVIDPMVIDKGIDRYRKGSRRLGDTAEHYGITLEDWHSADADALAAGLIAQKVVSIIPAELRDNLFRVQKSWAKEQSTSLKSHFYKKGQREDAASVEFGWPIIP